MQYAFTAIFVMPFANRLSNYSVKQDSLYFQSQLFFKFQNYLSEKRVGYIIDGKPSLIQASTGDVICPPLIFAQEHQCTLATDIFMHFLLFYYFFFQEKKLGGTVISFPLPRFQYGDQHRRSTLHNKILTYTSSF